MYGKPEIKQLDLTTEAAMCCEIGVPKLAQLRNPLFCTVQTCNMEVEVLWLSGNVPGPCPVN